ncbi:MAG: hypothetical protein JXR96_22815 [Deltaproteobacteria bacterium]|nr:hypothetical protein [Deltaproteobacteria bacterium]
MNVRIALCLGAWIALCAGCSDGECEPDCAGKDCGDDGCGGTCGPGCGELGTCVDGSCECEFEACGGTCCEDGQVCYGSSCCTPACDLIDCGDDGCGGDCGECPGAAGYCDADGFCQDLIAGLTRDPCEENHPICQTTAGCVLAEDEYVEGDFPGFRSFSFETQAAATVALELLFSGPFEEGAYEITRYGAGCADASGGNQRFTPGVPVVDSDAVDGSGEYLVEIYSETTAHYFLRISIE